MDPGPLLSQYNDTLSSSRSQPTTDTVASEELIPGSSPCALGRGIVCRDYFFVKSDLRLKPLSV